MKDLTVKQARANRRRRIRAKVRGSADRPRLAFFRSNKHLYAQVIDDRAGRTLASVSSLTKASDARGALAQASVLGEALAEEVKKKGIERVVFDRGGFLYTGSVQVFADAARKKGLQF